MLVSADVLANLLEKGSCLAAVMERSPLSYDRRLTAFLPSKWPPAGLLDSLTRLRWDCCGHDISGVLDDNKMGSRFQRQSMGHAPHMSGNAQRHPVGK